MRVFLSYSRKDRELVERLDSALTAAGFDTFLDTRELPIGQEYNARIERAVNRADLFIFVVSDDSVKPGSYALTELAFAESKWDNPAGYVMPVLHEAFNGSLPAYIKNITGPVADRNFEARVVGWVEQRSRGIDPDGPDDHSPQGRLDRWVRLAQPPIRGRQRAFAGRGIVGVVFGVAFIGFGIVWSGVAGQMPGPGPAMGMAGWLFAAIGVGTILYSIAMFVMALIGVKTPTAVVVVDRKTGDNSLTITVQDQTGRRRKLTPLRAGAKAAHSGDMGWAWIRGRLLIDFQPR